VAVGLMCRHCHARGELYKRIKDGKIGEITLLRAYRVAGPTGNAFVTPNKTKWTELMYQIRNFHGFLWASGGAFSDFLIHNIDECCWMKDAWPVEAKGYGGRHYRNGYIDQNFDVYTVEYTFADGAKLMLEGRCMPGCDGEFASFAHGTKGSAIISAANHFPALCRTFKNQKMTKQNQTWAFPKEKEEPYPYQIEWDDLMEAIRKGKPYNEAHRGITASLVTAMGRMACHTGRVITYKKMLELVEQEFAPEVDKLTLTGASPLRAGKDGKYLVPKPGIITDREY
jgi:predicted dehydrogenase